MTKSMLNCDMVIRFYLYTLLLSNVIVQCESGLEKQSWTLAIFAVFVAEVGILFSKG